MEQDQRNTNSKFFMVFESLADMPPDLERRFREAGGWPDDIDLIVYSPSGVEPPFAIHNGHGDWIEFGNRKEYKGRFFVDYHS